MKVLFLALLLTPLSVSAQTDTTFRVSDILKIPQPILIRDQPYTYTIDESTQTATQRIYTFDGVDVNNPRQTLTPKIRTINDPDANRELLKMQEIQDRRQVNKSIGLTLSIGGFVMMCVGAVQASDYKAALDAQRDTYYGVPAYSTVTTTKPVYAECSIWTGTPDPKTGVTLYTCATNRLIQSTNPGIGPYPIPGSAVTTTTTVYTPRDNPPTSVNLPDGTGFIVGGVLSMSVGLLIACLGNDGIDHFDRAVHFYNRAVSRRISWRLQPYSAYGQSGLVLRGRF